MRDSRRRLLVLGVLGAALLALGAPAAQGAPPPIWGLADTHTHQFSNLGFGGLVVWGQPFTSDDSIETALPWSDWTPGDPGDVVDRNGVPVGMTACPNVFFPSKCVKRSDVLGAECAPGTGTDILHPCNGFSVFGPGGLGNLLNSFLSESLGHNVGGYPEFDGWPRWNQYTSQQVYYDWLRRAYDGGLRLMVMLAVNNEALCRTHNRIIAGFGCDDMPAVDRQIQGAKALEAFIDAKAGGAGQGFYRIVYSGAQARQAIQAGKLAVVLGVEVPSLFGCEKNNAACTPTHVEGELTRYHDLGVRHVFPVHNADNAFGGTALYEGAFAFNNKVITGDWWSYASSCPTGVDFHLGLLDTMNDLGGIPFIGPALFALLNGLLADAGGVPPRPPAGPNCNARGLTPVGATLLNELIDRHMVIDIDHMSAPTFAAAMGIAETRKYPAISASHTGLIPTGNDSKKRHEGNKTLAQLERIRDVGGLVSIILHQGKRSEIRTHMRGATAPLPFDCGDSSQSWAQVYLYAVDHMNGGAVGIGSDFNGLAGMPAPRFGAEACKGDKPSPYSPAPGVAYPFTPFGLPGSIGQMTLGNKVFDYNEDGLANVGLLPDFVQDLRAQGMSNADLTPLFRSAEAYVSMWEKAADETPPAVQCASVPTAWHGANVALACTATDEPAGLANPADASFALTTSVAVGAETANASTDSRQVCDTRGNCVTVGPFTGIRVDRKAPQVACTAPDSLWHAADVVVPCTSTEGGSGLAAAGDASFALSTSVPAGTETDSAVTSARTVCDAVGNCSTVGPYTGLKVDKRAPAIVIASPTMTDYLHTGTLTLSYSAWDGGSGLGPVLATMDGSSTLAGHGLASDQAIDLLRELAAGTHTFAVQAADAVGNSATLPVVFRVIVTPDSVRAAVVRFRADGDIERQGLAQSLIAKLNAAEASRAAGNCATAASQYRAFINEVQAAAGGLIDADAAAILIADAEYLIANCP